MSINGRGNMPSQRSTSSQASISSRQPSFGSSPPRDAASISSSSSSRRWMCHRLIAEMHDDLPQQQPLDALQTWASPEEAAEGGLALAWSMEALFEHVEAWRESSYARVFGPASTMHASTYLRRAMRASRSRSSFHRQHTSPTVRSSATASSSAATPPARAAMKDEVRHDVDDDGDQHETEKSDSVPRIPRWDQLMQEKEQLLQQMEVEDALLNRGHHRQRRGGNKNNSDDDDDEGSPSPRPWMAATTARPNDTNWASRDLRDDDDERKEDEDDVGDGDGSTQRSENNFGEGGHLPCVDGETVGHHYVLIHPLGVGRSGRVWLAVDLDQCSAARRQLLQQVGEDLVRAVMNPADRPMFVAIKAFRCGEEYGTCAVYEGALHTYIKNKMELHALQHRFHISFEDHHVGAPPTTAAPAPGRPRDEDDDDDDGAQRPLLSSSMATATPHVPHLADVEPLDAAQRSALVEMLHRVAHSFTTDDITCGSYQRHLISVKDNFLVKGPHGIHHCLAMDVVGVGVDAAINEAELHGLAVPIVRSIMVSTLRGLALLAHLHIAHCDIKPENLLFEEVEEWAAEEMMELQSHQLATTSRRLWSDHRHQRQHVQAYVHAANGKRASSTHKKSTTRGDEDHHEDEDKDEHAQRVLYQVKVADLSLSFLMPPALRLGEEILRHLGIDVEALLREDPAAQAAIMLARIDQLCPGLLHNLRSAGGSSADLNEMHSAGPICLHPSLESSMLSLYATHNHATTTNHNNNNNNAHNASTTSSSCNFHVDGHVLRRILMPTDAELAVMRIQAYRRGDAIQSREYRAPEVILGQHLHTAVDVWSMGCVAYELVMGTFLFDAETTRQRAVRRRNGCDDDAYPLNEEEEEIISGRGVYVDDAEVDLDVVQLQLMTRLIGPPPDDVLLRAPQGLHLHTYYDVVSGRPLHADEIMDEDDPSFFTHQQHVHLCHDEHHHGVDDDDDDVQAPTTPAWNQLRAALLAKFDGNVEEMEAFQHFLRCCLHWDPSRRYTAMELLRTEWIQRFGELAACSTSSDEMMAHPSIPANSSPFYTTLRLGRGSYLFCW